MTKGVIATPHHLASEVGAQILRDGGNAIDAAIAADAVLCVVYPHMTSVGGDLMAIVWASGEDAPVGLIGAGRSGELATIEAVRERGHEQMPDRGALTITVPGTVEAWGRLLERFGSFGLGDVLEPAAGFAQDGYVITAHLSEALKSAAGLLVREPAAFALYPPMEAGMVLRNPDLASLLRDLGRNGINGFCRGATAAAIADAEMGSSRDRTSPSIARSGSSQSCSRTGIRWSTSSPHRRWDSSRPRWRSGSRQVKGFAQRTTRATGCAIGTSRTQTSFLRRSSSFSTHRR